MDSEKVANLKQIGHVTGNPAYHHYNHHHYYCRWLLACVVMCLCVVGAGGSAAGGGGGGEGDAAPGCTPCNSVVEADNRTLPYVGFVCLEIEALARASFTCIVSFRGDFNVTFYFHHVPSSLVMVELRTTYLDDAPDSEKEVAITVQDYRDFFEEVYHGFDLNLTVRLAHPHRPPLTSALSALYPAADEVFRGSINLTYVLQHLGKREEVVGNLEYSHPVDCSYNGVPVLQRRGARRYEFECSCGLNASGDHCHLGGRCAGRAPCLGRGYCRYFAGESICVCDEGYRGKNCRHHYTSIPSQDATCEGLLECHHQCHLQVIAQEKVTMCSCRAGYRLANKTHCVPQDVWDVTVVMKMAESGDGGGGGGGGDGDGDVRKGRAGSGGGGVARKGYTEREAVKKAREVLIANGGSAFTGNLSVTVSARRVDLLIKVRGAALARRLANTTTWRLKYPAANLSVSTVAPQLSVGPVGARWVEGGSLVLRCPVFGGLHLRFTWFKDGYQVFDHYVTNCTFKARTKLLHVVTMRGTTEYSCVDEMWVTGAQLEIDGGTYICRVEDRGYRATREVVVGYSDAITLLLQPRVATVHRGENVTLSCLTKNRPWVHADHYIAKWNAEPCHAYTAATYALLPRHGDSITLHGVTEPVRVRCVMRESEGMAWDAGRGTRDVEEASVEGRVYVITPATPTCPPQHTHGVTWPLTPVGVVAEEQCPDGFQGEGSTRACPATTHLHRPAATYSSTHTAPLHATFPAPLPYPTPATWSTPDFSACVRPQLSHLMTQLFLYERGYDAMPEGLRGVAKNLLGVLREGVLRPPLLSGEGASLLRILDLLELGRRRQQEEEQRQKKPREERQRERQKNRVPLGAFLSVVQVLAGSRDVVRPQDVGKMLRVARASLRVATEAQEDGEVILADLAARVAPVSRQQVSGGQHATILRVEHRNGTLTAGNGSLLVSVSVTVEEKGNTRAGDEMLAERSTREEGQKERKDEEDQRKDRKKGNSEHEKDVRRKREEDEVKVEGGVRVGVLVYPHVDTFLPQPLRKAIFETHYEVEWVPASPWVEVVAVGSVGGSPHTHTLTNSIHIPTTTMPDIPVVSQLWFPSSYPLSLVASSSPSASSSSSPSSSLLSAVPSSSPISPASTPEPSNEGGRPENREADEGEMQPTCAHLQVNSAGVVQVSSSVCSLLTEGVAGGHVCTCRGEGLFGLLLMSPTPVRISQEQEEKEDNKNVKIEDDNEKDSGEEEEGESTETTSKKEEKEEQDEEEIEEEEDEKEVEEEEEKVEEVEQWEYETAEWRLDLIVVCAVCVVSAVVSGVCVVMLVPEAYLSLVQLRLLKCGAITAFNLSLAVFTLSPYSQFVREGAVVVGGSNLVLCMGVGVGQQLALHQHLAVTTQATPIAALTSHAITLILAGFSGMVGLSAWGVQPRLPVPSQPLITPSWLVVGREWVAAIVVSGGAGVVTWVWVLLAIHNLRKLSLIREATPEHRSVAMVGRRMAQLTGMLVLEWTVFASSLCLHLTLGQSLFCIATLTQSLASLVLYWVSGGGDVCWCQRSPQPASSPDPDVPLNDGGDGEKRGCMGGLMACSLPPSKTYIARDDSSRKDYAFEFRGRGGSLWSQTTSTMVGLDPSDLLPSPTESTAQSRRELPLYARGANSVPVGARRPRNLFLRGTNFLCGEDVSSPQDHSLAGPSLDMDVRGTVRRHGLCFNFHQPVIHEVPLRHRCSDDKYLDMSVREYMNVPPASSRSRGRLATGTAKLVEAGDARGCSSYLPLAGARDGQVKADTISTSAGIMGAGVKAVGTVEGDIRSSPTSPLGTMQHHQAAPDDCQRAPRSRSSSLESENAAVKDSVEDDSSLTKLEDDKGTSTGRGGKDEAGRTPTRCPGTRQQGNAATELPE